MKTIELKPKPLRYITRTFFSLFIIFLIGKLWRYGMFEESEAWLFVRARVIEAFCDSSSVAALARLHARFKAQVMDHLMLNNTITGAEKSRTLSTSNR